MTTPEEFRAEGNRQFAQKRYREACLAYTRALQIYWDAVVGDRARADEEAALLRQEDSGSSMGSIGSAVANAFSSAFAALSSSSANSASSSKSGSRRSMSQEQETKENSVGRQSERELQQEQYEPSVLYSNRSASYLQRSMYAQAFADAKRAIELQPDWPKAYFRQAEALFAMKKYDECLASLYRALERYPAADQTSRDLIQRRIEQATFLLQDQNAGLRVLQLLAGRDFAVSSWSPVSTLVFKFANMLQNFIYVIGCERTKECVVVDVCWDVDGVLEVVREAGFTIIGAIVTHYHFDHVGGTPPPPYDQYRVKVDGIAKLLRKLPQIPAYIHSADIDEVRKANEIPLDRIQPTHDGFRLKIGTSVDMQFLHTPGHTPGSQCLLVNGNRLFSGDTLFIGNVGRLDFPDSDPEAMFQSLQKLKALTGDIMVYAGHDYGGSFTTLEKEKERNALMRAGSFQEFYQTVNAAAHLG